MIRDSASVKSMVSLDKLILELQKELKNVKEVLEEEKEPLDKSKWPMEGLTILTEFMSSLQKEVNCKEMLENYENVYNLKKYKITEILDVNVISMYLHIVDKFYKSHNPGESGTWVENELRLFLWVIFCYMELNTKNLAAFDKNDWEFFAKIFYVKEHSLFEYQARTLLDEEARNTKWTNEEDFTLYHIIIRDRKAKWNEIAKSLFVNSNKKYLRASKQCRERWLNHLDPSKSKSEWNLKEYLVLFEHVLEKGKKWALLVKVLNERRSEHSIKNKYNSIIRKQMRLTPDLIEKLVCQELIKTINRIFETCQIEPNDEYLFGCSLKVHYSEVNGKGEKLGSLRRSSPEELENYRSRFENFRKKIERFSCHQTSKYELENEVQTRTNRKIEQTKTMPLKPLEKRENEKKIPFMEHEEEIFYDEESFEVNEIMRPQYGNLFFTEDLRNLINGNELDV